jgi:uncharacterized membrane protein
MTVAAVRPDSWNLPLFLHVLGAMVLVGALVVVAWTLVKAWRGDADPFVFLAARVLTLVAIPSFLVMRVAAQWIADKEIPGSSDPSWIGIGYSVSDGGFLFLLVSSILVGIATRRLRRDGGASPRLVRVAAVLTLIPLTAYVVAIWAMTTKPA